MMSPSRFVCAHVLRPGPGLAVAAVLALLIALELGALADELRYERAAVATGQWWRLFSGHLVHLGVGHLVLNGAGLVLVMLLVGDRLRAREWLVVASVTALTIGLGLWFLRPQIEWYVGLSGILHGLVVAGAGTTLAESGRARRRRAALWAGGIIALVVLKLSWEQAQGPLPGAFEASGGPVVVDAHLFGALAGGCWAALRALVRRIRVPVRSRRDREHGPVGIRSASALLDPRRVRPKRLIRTELVSPHYDLPLTNHSPSRAEFDAFDLRKTVMARMQCTGTRHQGRRSRRLVDRGGIRA